MLRQAKHWLLYTRTPDLRATIDSIVRRVATWDWLVTPTLDPKDKRYEAASTAAAEAARWVKYPNEDGDTWQEVLTMFVTDLLVYNLTFMDSIQLTAPCKAHAAGSRIRRSETRNT